MVDCQLSPSSLGPPHEAAEPVSSKDAMWFLTGRVEPGEPIRHFPIHSTPFSIGRKANTSLPLSNRTVSSFHAKLVEEEGVLCLHDLRSTNGTFVNGNRVSSPVQLTQDDLLQFGDVVFRLLKQTTSGSTATVNRNVCDQAMSLVQFDRLMNEQAVIPYYQPIIDLQQDRAIAYEALGRSQIPGLETPGAMFSAAAQLNLEVMLSQMLRWKAVEHATPLGQPWPLGPPAATHLFLNTHPLELKEEGLLESMTALRQSHPSLPMTLEIHESAVGDIGGMRDLRVQLNHINIGLAFDDFGAGQARLCELTEVQPDYVKFDMSLIRSIHESSVQHRNMVAALVQMVLQMKILPLAEGIECAEEAQTCRELGFLTAQGYYFGRPAPA